MAGNKRAKTGDIADPCTMLGHGGRRSNAGTQTPCSSDDSDHPTQDHAYAREFSRARTLGELWSDAQGPLSPKASWGEYCQRMGESSQLTPKISKPEARVKEYSLPPWRPPKLSDDWRDSGPSDRRVPSSRRSPMMRAEVMDSLSGSAEGCGQPTCMENQRNPVNEEEDDDEDEEEMFKICSGSLEINVSPRAMSITTSNPTPPPCEPSSCVLGPPSPGLTTPSASGRSTPGGKAKLRRRRGRKQGPQKSSSCIQTPPSPRHVNPTASWPCDQSYSEKSSARASTKPQECQSGEQARGATFSPSSGPFEYQERTFSSSQRATHKFIFSAERSKEVTPRGGLSPSLCTDHIRGIVPRPPSPKTPPLPAAVREGHQKQNTQPVQQFVSKTQTIEKKTVPKSRPVVVGILKHSAHIENHNGDVAPSAENITAVHTSRTEESGGYSFPQPSNYVGPHIHARRSSGRSARESFSSGAPYAGTQMRPAAAHRSQSFARSTKGVVLSWEGVTVTSRRKKKILLDNLTGQVTNGFTAIMGPSGSGKTTLLNTLACRLDNTAYIRGEVRLNGREYTNTDLKKISGYVMQDDLLNGHLTVEETLQFTTKLRLEPTLTEAEVSQRVEDVIREMGLGHVRKTVIGSATRRGISGGERKRVCVGMELLTRPQLLFLDEPTSGLDSVTSLSLCSQLRSLADNGECTIICTIHQPQSKIFNLFHYLIILKAGQMVYQGKASKVLKFFEDSGFPCPEYTNPADHFLDVITPSINKPRDSLKEVDEVLRRNSKPRQVDIRRGSERPLQTDRERMPWHRQYLVLLTRSYKEQVRKRNVIFTQLIQCVLMALLIGGVFFQIGTTKASMVRRQPVLFFCVINQGVFGALTVINSFPGERAIVLRERAAGMYYCSAYFMAKVTMETVVQVVTPIVFSCVVYWMVGFQPVGGKFIVFTSFMVLCQLCATSLALMTSALCRTTDLSVTVLPLVLEVNRLFGGYFLSPKNLPKYFEWIDALSYVKYTYIAISLNELQGLEITCLTTELVNGVCTAPSGQQTIDNLGLGYLKPGYCAIIMISFILFTRMAAYLGIRYLKH